jgi:phage terminase small subunit
MKKKLTLKQEAFVNEYLIDLNATQAAIRAGYSPKRADAIGYENLRKPVIAEALAKAKAKREARVQITQDRVLKEEACLAFSDITEIFNAPTLLTPQDLPEHVRRSISSVKVKESPGGIREFEYKFWDKGAALKRVSQHLGLYEADNKQKNAFLELISALKAKNPKLAQDVVDRLKDAD